MSNTKEARDYAKWLHKIKHNAHKAKPLDQVKIKLTGTQPELEKMFKSVIREQAE